MEVLGSWSMPSEKQEGLDSFLRDLRTIFFQRCWLQVSREVGQTGFSCQLLPLPPGEGERGLGASCPQVRGGALGLAGYSYLVV